MTIEEQRMSTFFCLNDDMSVIERFLQLGDHKVYKKGEALIPINTAVDRLGYLKKGRAGRLVLTDNGSEKIIKIIGDKNIIGEVMFFKQTTSDHAFIALESCECYWFDRETVEQVFLKDDAIVHALIQWFCNRMMSLNLQIMDGMREDTYHRVCKFIEEYVKAFGSVDENGVYSYEGKLSHYDIAKYLGVNRVSVTRAISKLQQAEILKKDRRQLVVMDMACLEAQ